MEEPSHFDDVARSFESIDTSQDFSERYSKTSLQDDFGFDGDLNKKSLSLHKKFLHFLHLNKCHHNKEKPAENSSSAMDLCSSPEHHFSQPTSPGYDVGPHHKVKFFSKKWKKTKGFSDSVTQSEPTSPIRITPTIVISQYMPSKSYNSQPLALKGSNSNNTSPEHNSPLKSSGSPQSHCSNESLTSENKYDLKATNDSNEGSPSQRQSPERKYSLQFPYVTPLRYLMDEWMAEPTEFDETCLRGMERFADADLLYAHSDQEYLREIKGSRYPLIHTIRSKAGQKMYYISLEWKKIPFICNMRVLNQHLRTVIKIRGPFNRFTGFFDYIIYGLPSNRIGRVKHGSSFNCPCLIKDTEANTIFAVGSPHKGSYPIYDHTQRKIGNVFTKASDDINEAFNYDKFFGVHFPQDLEVQHKVLILSAALILEVYNFRDDIFRYTRNDMLMRSNR